MKFSSLADYLNKLEKTSSRNKMTEILAEVFDRAGSKEIDKLCYLALGRLAPKYEGLEFNMGEKLMIKAIAEAVDQDQKEIEEKYQQTGDLGDTLFKLKSQNSAVNELRVSQVYQQLLEIAQESGEGSVARKVGKMAGLLAGTDRLSAKYIARIPVNKLRLGFSDMTILDALSWTAAGDKSLRQELERAFNVLADIGQIAVVFKQEGLKGIKEIKSQVGVPIRPALAERLKNPKEILEKMDGKTALEPKMDGFRVQIHVDKSRKLALKEGANMALFNGQEKHFVRIFSRNLDSTTHMFPDVVRAAQKLAVKTAIFDGEAIAYDPETDKFLPFQETVQRKRKHGVKKKAEEVPLKVFVFDILYLNGQSLLDQKFKDRRQALEEVLEESQGEEERILLAKQKIVSRPAEFKDFFDQVVDEGLEGLMAKRVEASYQAGARNYTWVKYKAAMKSELADTIDCVVMGYYRGKGKRSQFGIGAFLVGVYDQGKFLTTSKIGTGLTDQQWRQMHDQCAELEADQQPKQYQVDKNLAPDIWCRPELVVEIEADTITKSPIHTAGLALRFPRLKRFRPDKEPKQATSLGELRQLAGMEKQAQQ